LKIYFQVIDFHFSTLQALLLIQLMLWLFFSKLEDFILAIINFEIMFFRIFGNLRVIIKFFHQNFNFLLLIIIIKQFNFNFHFFFILIILAIFIIIL